MDSPAVFMLLDAKFNEAIKKLAEAESSRLSSLGQ
jgi:hypothetical protein